MEKVNKPEMWVSLDRHKGYPWWVRLWWWMLRGQRVRAWQLRRRKSIAKPVNASTGTLLQALQDARKHVDGKRGTG